MKYISFIIPMRNDNYGGNLVDKLKYCHNHLASNLEKFKIESEIIYVDWNPPSHKQSLFALIKKINKSKKIKVKVIKVNSSFHKKYKYSKSFPIMMEVADNVGFQRSEATFSTNKAYDTYYSENFFYLLKNKKLDQNALTIISRNLISFNDLKKKRTNKKIKYLQIRKGLLPYPVNAVGDGLIMSNKNRDILKGFFEPNKSVGFGADGRLIYQASRRFKILYIKNRVFLNKIISNRMYINTTTTRYSKMSLLMRKYIPKNRITNFVFLFVDLLFGKPYIYRNEVPLGNPVFIKIYYFILRFVDLDYFIKSNNWGLKNYNLPVRSIN